MKRLISILFLTLIASYSLFARAEYKVRINPDENTTRAVDINNDGIPDYIIADSQYALYAINGKTQSIIWKFSKQKRLSRLRFTLVTPNIILVYYEHLRIIQALNTKNGSSLWEYKMEHPLSYSIKNKVKATDSHIAFWDSLQNFYIIHLRSGREIFIKRLGEEITQCTLKGDMVFIQTKNKYLFIYNFQTGNELYSRISLENNNKVVAISDTLFVLWNQKQQKLISYQLKNREQNEYPVEGYRPVAGGAAIPGTEQFFVLLNRHKHLQILVFDKKLKLVSQSEPQTHPYYYLYHIKWVKFLKDRILLYINYPSTLLMILDKNCKYLSALVLQRNYHFGREIYKFKEHYFFRAYTPSRYNAPTIIEKADILRSEIVARKSIQPLRFGSGNRYLNFYYNMRDTIIVYSGENGLVLALSDKDLSEKWNAYIGTAYNINRKAFEEFFLKKMKDHADLNLLKRIYTFDKKTKQYHLKSEITGQEKERLIEILRIMRFNQVRKLHLLSTEETVCSFAVEFAPMAYYRDNNNSILILSNRDGSIQAAISSATFGTGTSKSFWVILIFSLVYSPLLLPVYYFCRAIYLKITKKKPGPLKMPKIKPVKVKPVKQKLQTVKIDEFTSVVMEFIQHKNGEISILELMGITGYNRLKCEKLINKMLIEYEGEIKVKEDGNIVYDFGKFTREHEKTISRIIQLAARKKNVLTATIIAAELDIDLENALNYLYQLENSGMITSQTENGITHYLFP